MDIPDKNVLENKKLRPQYFFLSFGVLISLLTTVISFISLVFETLNKAFPDVLNATYQYGYNSWDLNGVRTSLAVVIIFFPIYIILSHHFRKNSNQSLHKNETILRKWMLYLILFLVALVSAIDLVTLIRYFVSGEITTRFILKVLSILCISGLLYWYYFSELKRNIEEAYKPKRHFILIATLLVLFGIGYSFNVIGTPQSQRAYRIDQKRLEDLQNIQSQIVTYWQQKIKLPEKLGDLIDPLQSWQVVPRDPEFQKGLEYEYRKISETSFELCATFKKPIPEGWQESGGMYPMPLERSSDMPISSYGSGLQNESWKHEAGRTCFARTVDKERYPPFNPTPKSE